MENLSKVFVIGNVLKAYCHNFDFHILALENNHKVINETFQPLFESNFFERNIHLNIALRSQFPYEKIKINYFGL
jgi:hypothetical protein